MRYWAPRMATLIIFLSTLVASTILALAGKEDASAAIFIGALIPMIISFFFWMEQ